MRRGALALTLATAVAAQGGARAAAGPSAKSTPAPPRTAEEVTAAERKAVRGTPVEGEEAESPELRELRRFERGAFPRPGDAPPLLLDPEEEDRGPGLPAGLSGRWGGSGDVPAELRPPTSPERRGPPPPPDSGFLRSLTLPDLPVRWEPEVLRFLEFFSKDPRGRAVMGNFMRRMGRYQARFEAILAREGAPRDLIYVAMIESGFQSRATSPKDAGGFWQFMPSVARVFGLEVSYWVDARRDPERATEVAARYFKDLYVRFGSWPLAFAAYHAGYGAVLSSIKRFNSNDYWELCKHEAGLPWETTHYVPKILAVAIISKNRAAFGFGDLVPDPPLDVDRVEVRGGTTLAAVARAVGTSAEVLADLNPDLLRQRVPPDRGTAIVNVPKGSGAGYAEGIERARGPADRLQTYVLRFGESLDDVAAARGIAARELRRLNGLRDGTELKGGTTVLVPPGSEGAEARPAASVPDEPILVAVPERSFNLPDRERVFFRTREGDQIEDLAEVFQIPVDDLVQWNNLDPAAKLHTNMVLQIFVKKGFDRAGVALLDPHRVRVVTLGSEEFHALEVARRGKTRLTYTARAGDTLAKIGRRYGLTPADLARINKLSFSAELAEGQKVIVYAPNGEPQKLSVGRAAPPVKRPGGAIDVEGRSPNAGLAEGKARKVAEKEPARPAAPGPAGGRGSARPASSGVPIPGKAAPPPNPRGKSTTTGSQGSADARARVAAAPPLPVLSTARRLAGAPPPARPTAGATEPSSERRGLAVAAARSVGGVATKEALMGARGATASKVGTLGGKGTGKPAGASAAPSGRVPSSGKSPPRVQGHAERGGRR
jgi:membrane-bound lytic murein transglycosylase D